MADAALFTADLALGLLLGCVFAVIAHGLNLIWGVAKVVNVAHGEFIMLGAYGAYFLNLSFGFNPLVSVPIDAAIINDRGRWHDLVQKADREELL